MDDKDEQDDNDNHTSNRILLAVLVIFISIPLILVLGDKFNSISNFMGPRFLLALVFVPAFFADRIYVRHFNNKKTHN